MPVFYWYCLDHAFCFPNENIQTYAIDVHILSASRTDPQSVFNSFELHVRQIPIFRPSTYTKEPLNKEHNSNAIFNRASNKHAERERANEKHTEKIIWPFLFRLLFAVNFLFCLLHTILCDAQTYALAHSQTEEREK